MLLQFFPAAGGTVSVDSIFITQEDLVAGGLSDPAELDDAEPEAVKRDKCLYAFLHFLANYVNNLAANDKLGFNVTLPDINSAAHQFTLTLQRYVTDNNDQRPLPLPVAVDGTNLGRGEVSIVDVFPNAVKVAANATVTEAGFTIGVDDLIPYGCSDYASMDVSLDARQFFYCFMKDATRDTTALPTKAATVDSSITARSVGTSSEISIPATYIAATNPLTSLVPEDAHITHLLSSGNVSLTFATLKTMGTDGVQMWELDVLAA